MEDKANIDQKRLESVVKSLQARIRNGRDADVVVKIRSGVVVEYTDTDIVRFK